MRYTLPTFCLFLISPVLAQQAKPAPAPLDISLRCSSVETTAQSRTVRSAAYGFGNPTHPDDDEFTKHVDRIVLIELHESVIAPAVFADDVLQFAARVLAAESETSDV